MDEGSDKPCGVVVIGAAGDIGGGICDSFLRDGWQVFAGDVAPVADREGLTPLEVDVRSREAVFAVAERAAVETRLRVWVNCAGIARAARILDASPEEWDEILAVNLTGTFHGCAAAMAVMARSGEGGCIVNLGSISGQIGGLGMHPAYGASKAGVHALTKSYALEGSKYGVRCNAVAPSVVEGSMAKGFRSDQITHVVATNPMRRLATLAEVVHAVRFLADEAAASYVNGVTLPVNGGAHMV